MSISEKLEKMYKNQINNIKMLNKIQSSRKIYNGNLFF